MKTWKELEAAGIHRCCATFKSGKQCRRRAAEPFTPLSCYCEKHAWIASAIGSMNKRVIEGMKIKRRR